MAPSAPATAPDQVFFGLTAGISFGPPKARPAKYPRTSVVQTIANKSTIARNPSMSSARSSIGASSMAPA